MNMQTPRAAFSAPPTPEPTLSDLEDDVCDVANFAAVCLNHVEALIISLRTLGHLQKREAAVACRILHTTSDAAELLLSRYYAALEADFAAKKAGAA